MYSLFEHTVPDSNIKLYEKLYYLGASSFSAGEATEDEKQLFEEFKTYMTSHELTSSLNSLSYKLKFEDGVGKCQSATIYGYIVDPLCQYVDISIDKSKLSITIIGADGILGSSDDIVIDYEINDIESYINSFKAKRATQGNTQLPHHPNPTTAETPTEPNTPQTKPSTLDSKQPPRHADQAPDEIPDEPEIDPEELSTWERYGIQFVRHITYPKKTTPSWIILKDSQNRFCAIITESKYPILQKNNYCIPFSGNDADLKDSFAGNRIAETEFPDHKNCKKIGIKSNNDYCNRFNQAFENMAEKEKFFSAASVCRNDPYLDDDFSDKICNYILHD